MRRIGHDYASKLRTIDVDPECGVDFKSLLLSEDVLKGLHEGGFWRPSPIQNKAIPLGKFGLGNTWFLFNIY